MDKAKALTGKYAGQPIAANKQGLTHELCREWKLYCPECYQFVHLRKSDKINSYFAHYDVEDKKCNNRTKYSSSNTINSIENCAKGQDLEVIQLEFESIFFEKYDEFKIDELKDLKNITNKCRKYFIENRKNIIKSCAQNNKFKHRGISIDVLNILFIDMNKDILKKLIAYAFAINPECSNQLDNITDSTIRSIIDSIIKIIADIDWNKPKSIIPENTNYSLEEENNTYNNPEEENNKDNLKFNTLTRNQQAAYLCSDVLNFMCVHETKPDSGKYLAYELVQISSSPFVVKITNLGEKTNTDVLSITFETGKLIIRSLMSDKNGKDDKGKKLPDKYVTSWNGLEIVTHLDAAVRIELPKFIRNAVEALNNNLVSPQWMFIAVMLRRLNVESQGMTDKAKVLEFTGNDVAWTLSECIRLSEGNNLPPQVVKLFKAEFNRVPAEIRKPFDVQEVAATEIKETNEIENIEPKIEVIQKPKNIGSIPKPIAVTRPLKVNENNLKSMPNLSVAQKIATLAGLNFQYNHRFTQKGKADDRYLVYEAVEVSKVPYTVKIINIGEKVTKDILSITLSPGKLEIKSLIPSGEGDKLPNKDAHHWGEFYISTHYEAVSLVVLPAMIERAVAATSQNLVSPKWLFVALLIERLKAEEQLDLTEKHQLKPYDLSDVAWTLSRCIEVAEQNTLPSAKLFKSEFNKLPEDVRKPFEKKSD